VTTLPIVAEGIVTSDDTVFEDMVAAVPASIAALSRSARAMIFDVFPLGDLENPALRHLVEIATTHRVPRPS
jgi:hypothetical protein